MVENQLSRYGALTRLVPNLAPTAKVFLVGDSDDTTYGIQNLAAEFPPDRDGVARVYSTIQDAVNAASAGRGDVVLVSPGYDHTLGRADSWATAGVSVIGLGSGNGRPTLRYAAATDEVGIAANNVRVSNLRFLADTSITRGLDLDSGFSGAQVDNCLFDFDSNGSDFKTMIRVAQSRSVIQDNEFHAEDTIGCGRAIGLLGGYADYLKIRRNFFYGQFDTNGDTTNNGGAIAIFASHDSGDTVLSGVDISNNTIVSTDTASSLLINLNPTALGEPRGVVSFNRLFSYDTAAADTASINLGATGGFLAQGNWFTDGDSDVTERLVGRQAKLIGLQDS